ncbi:hypothetical protein H0H93_002574, partial [Arthromyces matolae]
MQSPSVSINPKPASGQPDFSNVKSLYQQGVTPYDQLLPSDYMQRIPPKALEAFQSQKFDWDNIPEWVPPME